MNDAQLIQQILNGNMSAFRYLVDIHQKLVLHIVRRMVTDDGAAADICQDVFVKVYQKLGEFQGKSKLSTWIAQIAYNHAVNHLRRRKQLSEVSVDDSPSVEYQANTVADSGEWMLSDEARSILMQKVEELPHHYRAVLTLYYLEEFSIKEVAEVMAMPEGTVKSYLSRAKQQLREKLIFVQHEFWG